MNISFYLKSPETEQSLLMMYATYEGQRLRVSTGEVIPSKMWDANRQRLKKSYPNCLEINAWLETLGSELKKAYLDCRRLGEEATPAYLKDKINAFRKPTLTKAKITAKSEFFTLYQEYIEEGKKSKRDSVIKSHQTCLRYIKDFQTSEKYKVSFETINKEFYTRFLDYLHNIKNFRTKKKGISNNTTGKYIKNLKAFLRYSLEAGVPVGTDFIKFTVPSEVADTVALTEEDLKKIEGLDLSTNSRLRNVRDIFLLQCYTGLRFSDLVNLQPEDFNLEAGKIFTRSLKTKNSQIVTITDKVKSILDKYPDFKFPFISNQKTNVYLKELAKLAELNDAIRITRFIGKDRVDIFVKKHEVIGTHTARRTFITISLMRGLLPEVVMQASGHKRREQFQKYVRIVEQTVLDEMNRIWK